MALLVASMPLFDPAVEDAARLAPLGALGIAVPALFLLKVGIDVRRTRIVVGSEALDVCLSVFRIWSLRKVRCAQCRGRTVFGVQRFEIVNPMAPSGVQVDYILHTRSGLLAMSSMQFDDVDEIAGEIAARTGRAVGELAEGTAPFATRTGDRRGVSAMRALGWVATTVGLLLWLLVPFGLFASEFDTQTTVSIAGTGALLMWLGRFARGFNLR